MGYFSELDLELNEGYISNTRKPIQEEKSNNITISYGTTTPKARKKYNKQKKFYPNTEILDFLKCISATDNFKTSCTQVYTFIEYTDESGNKQKRPQLLCFGSKSMGFDSLHNIRILKSKDYYYTPNGFYADHRKASSLFTFNNIVIDIDNHRKKATPEEILHEVNRLLFFLDADPDRPNIPEYNVLYTGRGVQLIISLESFHAKYKWLWKDATELICQQIQQFIDDYNKNIDPEYSSPIELQVDTGASTKATTLMRLPFTYNTHTKTKTLFKKRTDKRYTLTDLANLIAEAPNPKRKPNQKIKTQYTTTNTGDYTGLQFKRTNYIKDIIKDNNYKCNGRRELLTWLYYNAMVQLTDRPTAKEMTYALNNSFTDSLKPSEIEAMFRCTDAKGFYKIPDDKFLDFCNATQNERMKYINTPSNLREQKRAEARAKKAERDTLIHELYSQGKTYQEIADTIKCSLRTVKNKLKDIAKTSHINRDKQILQLSEQGLSQRAIANKVGCSPTTVNQVIKANNQTSNTETSATTQPQHNARINSKIPVYTPKSTMAPTSQQYEHAPPYIKTG